MRYLWVLLFLVVFWTGCSPAPSNEKVSTGETTGKELMRQERVKDATAESVPERLLEKRDPDCVAGDEGCRCELNSFCNKGLRCDGGICRRCKAGTAGCPCEAGSKCASGLSCNQGICGGCKGKLHCACFANARCDRGLHCGRDSAGKSRCVSCAGEKGCGCSADGDCKEGFVCLHRRCQEPGVLKQIPQNPLCFTSCSGDVTLPDGKVLSCSERTQIRTGCAFGKTCHQGSCLTDAQRKADDVGSYPYCNDDGGCLRWQACIAGRCYSSCQKTLDCQKGAICYQNVCRKKCDPEKPSCVGNTFCRQLSSESGGACLPLLKPRTTPDAGKKGLTSATFSVSPRTLELSTDALATSVILRNTGTRKISLSIQGGADAGKTDWLEAALCKSTGYNKDRTTCSGFEKSVSLQKLIVSLEPGKNVIVKMGVIAGKRPSSSLSRLVEFRSPDITLSGRVSYRETKTSAVSQWSGTFYTFSNFPTKNISRLNDDSLQLLQFNNALLQGWLRFKRGFPGYSSFPIFRSMLRSIESGSWNFPRVVSECKKKTTTGSDETLCFPNDVDTIVMSHSKREAPAPSAGVKFPFVINMAEGASEWRGRVDSDETLLYPGNPLVTLKVGAKNARGMRYLSAFSFQSLLGGRYAVTSTESCVRAASEVKKLRQWMLTDFAGKSFQGPGGGLVVANCLNKTEPFKPPQGATPEETQRLQERNSNLSAANPIPDGRLLRRKMQFLAGVIANDRTMFVLVKETFTNFVPNVSTDGVIGSRNLSRYGYLLLEKTNKSLTPKETQGNQPTGERPCTSSSGCASNEVCENKVCRLKSQLKQVRCTPQLISKASDGSISSTSDLERWTPDSLKALVKSLTLGATDTSSEVSAGTNQEFSFVVPGFSYPSNARKHYVHYYCEDKKSFNAGMSLAFSGCPTGSKVTFFASLDRPATLASRPCNGSGTCQSEWENLKSKASTLLDLYPRCKDPKQVFCDDPTDLRKGKLFQVARMRKLNAPSVPWSQLSLSLQKAFRYRLKFVSSSGKRVGFKPSVCSSSASTNNEYCYDPKEIEQLAARVNCLEYMYANPTIRKNLGETVRGDLKSTLAFLFSFKKAVGSTRTVPGFEMLNAELRVMLGDDFYVRALNIRSDLAGTTLEKFPGADLEPGGINLSGPAGAEMLYLYRSVAYYQSVLDRFYAQSKVIGVSFQDSQRAFLNQNAVDTFFKLALKAATSKARSWSKIAEKYFQLGRKDLSQLILKRSYITSYLEMVTFTSLLSSFSKSLGTNSVAQLQYEIKQASRYFASSQTTMAELVKRYQEDIDYFGFKKGAVPIPPLDSLSISRGTDNIVSYSLRYAKEKVRIALIKEQVAIQSNIQTQVSAAAFRAELQKLETFYNGELSLICGTVTVAGRQLPAIPANADLSPTLRTLGNPCGRLLGSTLYDAYQRLESLGLQAEQLNSQKKAIEEKIELEEKRIKTLCTNTFSLSDIEWEINKKNFDLQQTVSLTKLIIGEAVKTGMEAVSIAQSARCATIFPTGAPLPPIAGESCSLGIASKVAKVAISLARAGTSVVLKNRILETKKSLATLSRDLERVQDRVPCNVCPPSKPNCDKKGIARVESQLTLKRYAIELLKLQLESDQLQVDFKVAFSEIKRLRDRAERLIQERRSSIEQWTNVNAASNDPTQRLYTNSSIKEADRTFREALREAYKTTLLFEYYTNQSYAFKSDLYLVRMVAAGDINLEAYLSKLELAFRSYREKNGLPTLRVMTVSLMEDILQVPSSDSRNNDLTAQERIDLLHAMMKSGKYRDAKGLLTFPFSVRVGDGSRVSPLTYNHKVQYVEAQLQYTGDVGTEVFRLYLRQDGLGLLKKADGEIRFLEMPRRMAVVSPYFRDKSKLKFNQSVYRSFAFQNRPLGNLGWKLQLNFSTENVNKFYSVDNINDILIHIFYTDETKQQ